jgi:hypothetical protein
LLLLHLLLVKEDLRLNVNWRMIHVFLVDVVIKVVEDGLDSLQKFMEAAILDLLDCHEVEIGYEFSESTLLGAAVFSPLLSAEAVQVRIEMLEAGPD